ncbi:MAG: hypothetical protein AAFR96_04400 [Planctomycetota bacterium]
MPIIRRFSLTLLSVLATLWAVVLVVTGLAVAVHGVPRWIDASSGVGTVGWRALGAAMFCGGQFVFMFMVADRLFPRATRRPVTWVCEIGIVFIGMLALAIALVASAVQGSL